MKMGRLDIFLLTGVRVGPRQKWVKRRDAARRQSSKSVAPFGKRGATKNGRDRRRLDGRKRENRRPINTFLCHTVLTVLKEQKRA